MHIIFKYYLTQKNHRASSMRLQKGFTLTGLMISIVLVQAVVLVSLKLQSSHHRSVSDVQTTAVHNRVLITALIVAQKEIQSAGYGIVGADENDIATLFTLPTSTTAASHSIVWRYTEDGLTYCRGLQETGVTLDGIEYRQLDFVRTPSDCNSGSPLANKVWDTVISNLGRWEIDDLLQAHLDNNGTLFNFQLAKQICTVNGITPNNVAPNYVATISVPNRAELNGHILPSNVYDLCLLNIHPS